MKLEGIRVIDLSVFLPGPYLTLAMADHGAEVIKVEPPGEGDPGRHIGLSDGPSTVFFRNLNRGKKSVVLDLKERRGARDPARALRDRRRVRGIVPPRRRSTASASDMRRCARAIPRIVYCSISAFGQDGAYRDRPAHDLALEAISGLLSMTLGNDGKPAMPGIPVADILAALQGLSGVLMALLRRESTGRGDYIDIACMTSRVGGMLPTSSGPRSPRTASRSPAHERTTGGAAFYRPYETARWPPPRARRAGDEVHPQPARRARPPGPGRTVPAAARARTSSR